MFEFLYPPDTAGYCRACGLKLSKELDAYYGKDTEAAKRCVKCRPAFEKTRKGT